MVQAHFYDYFFIYSGNELKQSVFRQMADGKVFKKCVSKKSGICAILFGATCSAEIIHYLNNHCGKFIE